LNVDRKVVAGWRWFLACFGVLYHKVIHEPRERLMSEAVNGKRRDAKGAEVSCALHSFAFSASLRFILQA